MVIESKGTSGIKDCEHFKFIKTSDEETRTLLLSLGFQTIAESSGVTTFINSPTERTKSIFAKDVNKLSKVCFSNILTMV